jgi:hypothetical protein
MKIVHYFDFIFIPEKTVNTLIFFGKHRNPDGLHLKVFLPVFPHNCPSACQPISMDTSVWCPVSKPSNR